MGGEVINTLVAIGAWIILFVVAGAAALWCLVCATASWIERHEKLADERSYGDHVAMPSVQAPRVDH